MYFSAMYRLRICVDIARRSSTRGANNGEMAKTSLHIHTALARLPGVS